LGSWGRVIRAMLFGRDAERARLVELLDSVESGPVALILEGPAGIGKTTLWRESVESARQRGYQVLETAPSEPEALLAFAGLGDLFERIPDELLDALPDVQAHALRAALVLGELPEEPRDVQALPRAILRVLRQLSAAGPVLIAIDDEQWLDPASARVLAFALCRLHEERIVLMLARRPEREGTLSAELGQRFGDRLSRMALEPLPMRAIKMLFEARLDWTVSTPVLRRIHQVTAGNPLWALAIAVEMQARHSGVDRAGDLAIPRTLSDALELRLKRVDPCANAAMLAIAALSQPTLGTLQAAIPEFALSDLASAEQAGVIEIAGGRVRFTHPLLASTHYQNTLVSRRRELHRLLATVIDDEEERAHHLALGAEAPDRGLADSLEQAAGVAARRGATESAAQLLEDAARLTPIDQTQAQRARVIAAAEHRFKSGEVSRARHMLTQVMADLAGGPLKARARLQLADMSADEPRVAMELLEAALADVDEDHRLRVQIECDLTAAASGVGRPASARDYAQSALRTAERVRDPELVARALGQLLITFITTGEPLREDVLMRLRTVEELAGMTTYYQPATAIALTRYFAGDFEEARPGLERAAQRALSRDEEWDRLGLELTLAEIELELGNLPLAEQHRHAAHEALGEFSEALVLLFRLDARFALGCDELVEARMKVEQGLALAERTGDLWQAAYLIPLLAAVELREGHSEIAHARLKEQREWLGSIGYGRAGYARANVWSLDLEALIALGRPEEAEEVLAELRSRAEACNSDNLQAIAARAEGMLLAAGGELSAAIDAMDRAIAAHLRCRRPFEHGRTLLEKGSIQRRAKRKADAKQTLEQALAILEPLGAQSLVTRARDELSRIGLRRAKATEGLTPAQARVAELVVAGSTNAEIARELHMSLRTVESHLSRVYREHGVTSRTQLVAALAAPSGSERDERRENDVPNDVATSAT
jgi:DNA-binding NarL/FixJ family response regulator